MAIRSMGTEIKFTDTDVPCSGFYDIGFPSDSVEQLDVTTHDSTGNRRKFIGGFIDSGEVALKGYFISTDPGQIDLFESCDDQVVDSFTITLTDGTSTIVFDALVSKCALVAGAIGDVTGIEVSLKITGDVTYSWV